MDLPVHAVFVYQKGVPVTHPSHNPAPNPHAAPYGLPTPDGGPAPQAVPQAPQAASPAPEAADPSPVLSPVGAPYAADAPDGVNVGTMPAFKDMRRVLPAERIAATAALARVAKSLPESLSAQDGAVNLDSLDGITADDLDAVADMFAQAQGVVLDWAMDREAMTEWMLDQADPLSAVMAAFSRFQAHLGN